MYSGRSNSKIMLELRIIKLNLHGGYIGKREAFVTLISIISNSRVVRSRYEQNHPQNCKEKTVPTITADLMGGHEDAEGDEDDAEDEEGNGESDLLDGSPVVNGVGSLHHNVLI